MALVPEPSQAVVLMHVVLTVLLGLRCVQGVWRAGARLGQETSESVRRALAFALLLAVWLIGTHALARSGVLLDAEASPPRFLWLMAPAVIVTVLLAHSSFGELLLRGLPLWILVAYQVFRVAVELILWRLHQEGIVPRQMTFAGQNFDVVSGASALPIAWLLAKGKLPRWALAAWNVVGLALLARIVFIAVRSMPGPLRGYAEEPANTIVLSSIFVWIPTFYVLAALFGHVLVFRALRRDR